MIFAKTKHRSDKEKPETKKGLSAKNKYVLIVGDDGAILVYLKGNKISRRMFCSAPDADEVVNFNELIGLDSTAPVYIMVDLMEQSFTKQTFPPVSSASISKLVKRRLERDFSSSDLKGSIPLGRSKIGKKEWNYLFATTPSGGVLGKWIDVFIDLPNQLVGVYLIPSEAQTIISRVSKNIHGNKKYEKNPPKWQILVSHNKVSGVRQIIFHNGTLILTRLSQSLGEDRSDVMAGSIEQEIQTTKEFLKRLGLDDADEIEVTIIASDEIKSFLDINRIRATRVVCVTPYELTESLGIGSFAEQSDRFGDIALSCLCIASSRHILKLETLQIAQLNKLHLASRLIKYSMSVIIPLCLVYYGIMGYDIVQLKKEISLVEESQNRAKQSIAGLEQDIVNLPEKPQKINNFIDIYHKIETVASTPMLDVTKIASMLSSQNIVAEHMAWKTTDPLTPDAGGRVAPVAPSTSAGISGYETEILLSFVFPDVGRDVDKFIKISDDIINNLKTSFDGHDVSYTKIPNALDRTKKVEIKLSKSSDSQTEISKNDRMATIRILKPIRKTNVAATK